MKVKEDGEGKPLAQVKLNLPPSLHRQIKIRAATNVRSLNGEMVYLMQQAIAAEGKQPQGAQA